MRLILAPIGVGLISRDEMSRGGIRLTVSEMRGVYRSVRGEQLGETWGPIDDRIAGYAMRCVSGRAAPLPKGKVAGGVGGGCVACGERGGLASEISKASGSSGLSGTMRTLHIALDASGGTEFPGGAFVGTSGLGFVQRLKMIEGGK